MRNRDWVRIPTFSGGKVTQADVEAFRQLQKSMVGVGSDVKKEMRTFAKGLMKPAADDAMSRATLPLQKKVAKSIRPEFFKGLPAITAGGSKRLTLSNGRGGTHEVWAGEVFAGSEFGSNGGMYSGHKTRHGKFIRAKNKTGSVKQFPPRTPRLGRGNAGYFFYPALRAKVDQPHLLKEYFKMVGQIYRKYGV